MEINAPTGTVSFAGTTSFEQSVGTLTWSNLAREVVFSTYTAVDADWGFQITDPAPVTTGNFGGRVNIFNLAWSPDAATSLELASLIGRTIDVSHPGGTLTVEMLNPTVTGDGFLLPGVWINPEGGVSTLHLNARFTNVATAGPVVPEPTSLALFGIGVVSLGVVQRRRRR
jgi:hypothetical protein